MLFDFLEPFNQRHEGFVSGNVVGKEHAVSTSVKNTRDRLKRLLACRVPDLYFDHLFVHLQVVRAEFYSDGHLVIGFEFVIHNSLHQTQLADSSATYNDQFEKMVVLG